MCSFSRNGLPSKVRVMSKAPSPYFQLRSRNGIMTWPSGMKLPLNQAMRWLLSCWAMPFSVRERDCRMLTPPRHHEKGKSDQNSAKGIEKRAEQAHQLTPRDDAALVGASLIIVAEHRATAHPFCPQIPAQCCAEDHEYEQHQSLD